MAEDNKSVVDTEKRHNEICEMVAEGMTIRQIASHYGASVGSVINWATDTPEHAERYARAREAASDMFECEIIESALSVSPETAAADRVKIDAMKWVAARRSPKKYGDKIQQDVISSDRSMTPASVDPKLVSALIDKLVD